MNHIKKFVFLFILLFLAYFLYQPALSGGFIFDDIYSLTLLKYVNNDLSLDNLLYYFAHSDTGPLKRPISVFSFLIDAQDWPAIPPSFKRTNLIIHIINGAILFSFLASLLKTHVSTKKYHLQIAFFASAFWLLHPFLLSTTMYIVQRMAMLSVTFILCGLWLYTIGRINHNNTKNSWNLVMMFLAVYVMTLLSMLSKENGVLLLAFIALLEYFVFNKFYGYKKLSVKIEWLLIKLPVAMLILMILVQIPRFIGGYELREFTLYERLLSESRAIFKYLYHLFVPHYLTEGVFTDGFKKSINLFEPITTLFSVGGIIFLIIGSWLIRNRWPLLSLGVLFFFVAHSLESTFVPLELYFEHRNYAAFLLLPLPFVIVLIQKARKKYFAYVILSTLLLFTAFQTYLRAQLWGNNFIMHQQTMTEFPESVRARNITATFFDHWEATEESKNILIEGIKLHDNLDLKANLLSFKCDDKTLNDDDVAYFVNAISQTKLIKNDLEPLGRFIFKLMNDECVYGKTNEYLKLILDAMEGNLDQSRKLGKPLLYYSKGRLLFKQGDYQQSVPLFMTAFDITRNYIIYIKTITVFLEEAQPELALELIDFGLERFELEYKYKIDWLNIEDELYRFRWVATEDIANKK